AFAQQRFALEPRASPHFAFSQFCGLMEACKPEEADRGKMAANLNLKTTACVVLTALGILSFSVLLRAAVETNAPVPGEPQTATLPLEFNRGHFKVQALANGS